MTDDMPILIGSIWTDVVEGGRYRVIHMGQMEISDGEWVSSVTYADASGDALWSGSTPFWRRPRRTRAKASFRARFKRVTP